MRRIVLAVILITGLLPESPAAPDNSEALIAADEQRLDKAKIKSDGESLLAFFRERTVRVEQAEIRNLVKQLSHRSYAVRQRATNSLITLGTRAVSQLKEASKSDDLEVRRRAEDCLRQIQNNSNPLLTAAAGRMLAIRKPAGAAQALLDFLPAVMEDDTLRELHAALAKLTLRDGKVEPCIFKALEDEDPVRRAATAVALCRADVAEKRDKVRALLRDPSAEVRLYTALSLLQLGEKESIPVLIALFERSSRNQLWQAEDALYRLAGDKAPAVAFEETAEKRKAYCDGWMSWWKEHGDKLDVLARLKNGRLDYTLIVLLDEGEVLELDAKDNVRFRISKVGFPLDAQTLPGERVLLAEHGGSRVTERLRDGTILWEKKVSEPLAAQRLDNGHTFIGSKNEVMEVDREGKVVFSWSPGGVEQIMRAMKLADGSIAIILHDQQRFIRLDANGQMQEGFSFNVNVQTFGGRVDVQRDGHVLIPQMYMNKVVEYDGKGKAVREFSIGQPIVATRLPNGHTIITSMNENRAVEFDLAGKQVWEYRAKTRVTRAYRR
jgi:HEAT repeat protein